MTVKLPESRLRKMESLTIRSGTVSGDIDLVVFPNRIQLGLDNSSFNNVNVVSGSLKVTENLKGKSNYYTYHNFTISTTTKSFVPINVITDDFGGHLSDTSGDIGFQAPHDGQLKKVMIKLNGNWGSSNSHTTAIGFHTGSDGTQGVNSTAYESNSVVLGSSGYTANTNKTVTFSNSSFIAGETVAVSITPYASTSLVVRMTCVWEYDTNT